MWYTISMDRQEYKRQWYLANRERIRAKAKAAYIPKPKRSEEELQKSRIASWRKYNQTPFAKYTFQKKQANLRGIEWQLTFDEWYTFWQESGHWEERGQQPQQYCMCRYQDIGPYSLDNIYIDTTSNNAKLVRYLNRKAA